MPLSNPYNTTGRDWANNQRVSGRVDPTDYAFLKRRYPLITGLHDRLISTLYKKLLDELRRIDSTAPIEPAWSPLHPSVSVLELVLERCSFGNVAGQAGPRHDERGTGGIREEMRPPAVIGAIAESCTEVRRDSTRSGKKNKKGKSKG